MPRISLKRSQLNALSTIALIVIVLVVLITTLTPVGTGPPSETEDVCALGLPCVVGHVVLFGALGLAAGGRYAASATAMASPRRVLGMVFIAIWIFAAVDELAQEYWVEGRGGQLADWGADMIGAVIGLALTGPLMRGLVRVRAD